MPEALLPITKHPSATPEDPDQAAQPSSGGAQSSAQELQDSLAVLREYEPENSLDDTAEVIRAFLDHLPQDGQRALMADICRHPESDRKLRQLRDFLVDALLKSIKVAGAATPSTGSILGSWEPADIDEVSDMTGNLESPSRAGQGALRNRCLARDGYRCVMTGSYDMESFQDHEVVPPDGATVGFTKCAHILPYSLRSLERMRTRETKNNVTVWWALRRYFPSSIGDMTSSTINRVENAMTLSLDAHGFFGEFKLAFVPADDGLNKYTVEQLGIPPTKSLNVNIPQTITLGSEDPTSPPPSPGYLDIHLRIARILEASGVGRKIEQTLAGPEPYGVDPCGGTDLGEIMARKLGIYV